MSDDVPLGAAIALIFGSVAACAACMRALAARTQKPPPPEPDLPVGLFAQAVIASLEASPGAWKFETLPQGTPDELRCKSGGIVIEVTSTKARGGDWPMRATAPSRVEFHHAEALAIQAAWRAACATRITDAMLDHAESP